MCCPDFNFLLVLVALQIAEGIHTACSAKPPCTAVLSGTEQTSAVSAEEGVVGKAAQTKAGEKGNPRQPEHSAL